MTKKVAPKQHFFAKGEAMRLPKMRSFAQLSFFEKNIYFHYIALNEGLIHQFCCKKVVIHFFKYKTKFFNHLRHVILQS